MKKVFVIVIFLPLLLNAQKDLVSEGIKFEQSLKWQEILVKAKAENKYIFIDCYATWCRPCKEMDTNVFSSPDLGEYMNANFISTKLQMDTSKYDNDEIQSKYPDAFHILRKYKIDVLPSYLFFSPDGKIIHRGVGYKKVSDFILFAKNALDSNKQFNTLIEKYKQGKVEDTSLSYLAITAKIIGQNDIANSFARSYIGSYLNKLNIDQLINKENIEFITYFINVLNSNDNCFTIIYTYRNTVDELMNKTGYHKGYSKSIIEFIISKEEINNRLFNNGNVVKQNPDWKRIRHAIIKKYNSYYSESLLTEAKLSFYRRIKNWDEFVAIRNKKIKEKLTESGKSLFNKDGTWVLNIDAWDVFVGTNNISLLKNALEWIDLAIKLDEPDPNVQFLDTRANILYKLGRVDEAIAQEQKAIDVGIANAKKGGRIKGDFFDDFTEIINKMRIGKPTWFVHGESTNKK